MHEGFDRILTPEALAFIANLHRKFNERRLGLLRRRNLRQAELDRGVFPTFLEHTRWVREGTWRGPSIPRDLMDRRVEITGPVDRKMVINALNSGAKVFMADFEDSSSPTWFNMVDGQINMRDAVHRTISFRNEQGKEYKLKPADQVAVLMVRPRGWHLDEPHLLVDGEPTSGSLFDFGLFFFHAWRLLENGSGPYFYLPKMESHLEARLWNDVFVEAQERLGIPRGTIRATVLVETLLAAFEMDEILFELRDHSAGMNCGRWDYIFSAIKKFRAHKQFVLPDRVQVTMTTPFMAAYVQLVIQTCHKRGVHAMGGMAAQIPVKNNPAANQAAMDKVKADKLREVKAGHDGTWVAHPDLIPMAMSIFNEHMPTPNQINAPDRSARPIKAEDLLPLHVAGKVTEAGLRENILVGLQYLDAWIRGVGCVPINNLMEDAATAEICRSQIWQWIRHGTEMELVRGGSAQVTKEFVSKCLQEELAKLKPKSGNAARQRSMELTGQIYSKLMLHPEFIDFMTLEAYPHIVAFQPSPLKSSL